MYFTYRRKSLGLHSDRSYHMALIAANICLLSDVLSNQALAHLDMWPMLITKFVCKLYINMLVFVAFFAFSYIASDLLHRKMRKNAGMISGKNTKKQQTPTINGKLFILLQRKTCFFGTHFNSRTGYNG